MADDRDIAASAVDEMLHRRAFGLLVGKFTASTVGVSSQASSSTNGLPPLSLDSGTFVPKPVACRISPSNSCPENGLLLSACSAASGEYCVCSMNGISPRDTISLLNACVSR